jgi:D-cysteine desulfhydrase
MTDALAKAYPRLGECLTKVRLAELPTPVFCREVTTPSGKRSIAVKCDDVTNPLYGGNKVRKLEYIFQRALDRKATRVATFGTAGSNHALATAILANDIGLECTCFLAHQKRTPKVPYTLNMHRHLGTEIVRYGGSIVSLPLLRKHLQHRNAWVVPLGGSSWLGAAGFVNAGFELAEQVEESDIPCPARIYIANGTMGSVAGLLLGLAAAEMPIDVHAVRVADNRFTNPAILDRLMRKTALLLHRIDPEFDTGAADRARLFWRDDFFAGGYAVIDERISDAVAFASDELGLSLETTYTGKAMAALLHDIQQPEYDGETYLFWNTHSSRNLPVSGDRPDTLENIPEDFLRYYD